MAKSHIFAPVTCGADVRPPKQSESCAQAFINQRSWFPGPTNPGFFVGYHLHPCLVLISTPLPVERVVKVTANQRVKTFKPGQLAQLCFMLVPLGLTLTNCIMPRSS